jgi:hypothetical protein
MTLWTYFALRRALLDEAVDLGVELRVQHREGQVLELALDRLDAEPVRQRRVDLEVSVAFFAAFSGGTKPQVRALCRRSASLMISTRMSFDIATIILRTVSPARHRRT